ncbi:hypothetical protein [Flavobacterium psychraquaticum]|uniref:hypothetical protein n=1 Tax=Flavobacterium psychraquaticum TaxID=3103958 RepID=UPI002ACD2510|nr:hypothetical protein [Flavobacterium sp. LB-N7T]
MKKLIILVTLTLFNSAHSQKLIIEEKYEKDNIPVDFGFVDHPDRLIIEKGKNIFASTNENTNNIYSYNTIGEKAAVLENVDLMYCTYSNTGNTVKATDYSSLRGIYEYNFFSNGKKSSTFERSNYNSFSDNQIIGQHFNDKYLIFLSNEKGKDKLDLKKNDVYVEIIEIFTNKTRRLKIDNINIERLTSSDNINYSGELGFTIRLIGNDSFEIVTKSIAKDYKSTILYRTLYDFNGNLTEEFSYEIKIKDNFLTYSNSGATYVIVGKFDNTLTVFANDLAINNFIIDNEKNVYVYGLLTKKSKSMDSYNEVSGFYVFKFDKNGNKIWELSKEIDDKKDFNRKIHLYRLQVALSDFGNELIFNVGTNYYKEYFHYFILDKKDGIILKQNKVEFKEKKLTPRDFYNSFIPEVYKLPSNENILTNKYGLILYDFNTDIKNYVDSLNKDNKLNLKFLFSSEGIWLIESDNEKYYKVLFFEK